MTDSRKLLVAALLFGFASSLAHADHFPLKSEGNLDYEGNLRLFLKHKKVTGFAEIKGRFEQDKSEHDNARTESEFRYRSVTVGPYFRLHPNVKLGAFYRAQQGARHDDDWVWLNPGWEWQDTTNRTEHLLIGDLTPRFLLSFMPGKNWVFEVKNRYELNTFNEQSTYMLRPGLTYIWMRNNKPFINFFAQYELWFPVDWGEHTIWETWIYGGVLFHATQAIKVGAFAALREGHWSRSEDFKRVHQGENYSDQEGAGEYSGIVVGLTVLYRLVL